MGTESERQDTKKAMAYDLIRILRANPKQETYTADEVEKLINTYIETSVEK